MAHDTALSRKPALPSRKLKFSRREGRFSRQWSYRILCNETSSLPISTEVTPIEAKAPRGLQHHLLRHHRAGLSQSSSMMSDLGEARKASSQTTTWPVCLLRNLYRIKNFVSGLAFRVEVLGPYM